MKPNATRSPIARLGVLLLGLLALASLPGCAPGGGLTPQAQTVLTDAAAVAPAAGAAVCAFVDAVDTAPGAATSCKEWVGVVSAAVSAAPAFSNLKAKASLALSNKYVAIKVPGDAQPIAYVNDALWSPEVEGKIVAGIQAQRAAARR